MVHHPGLPTDPVAGRPLSSEPAQGSSTPKLRSHQIALLLAVVACGIALSAALFWDLDAWERRAVQSDLAVIAHEHAELLRVKVECSLVALRSIGSLYQVRGEVSRQEFAQFVHEALDRQPELQALEWVPRVPGVQRAAFESTIRSEGYPLFGLTENTASGAITTAGVRGEYFPVAYVEPMERNSAAFGLDMAAGGARREALELARDTGEVVATAPIALAQDMDKQPGFLMLMPIYQGTPTSILERRRAIRGVAQAVFRVQDLVGPSLKDLQERGITVRVADVADYQQPLFEQRVPNGPNRQVASAVLHGDTPTASCSLRVGGRPWLIEFKAAPAFLTAHHPWQSWAGLIAGLTMTALLTGWQRSMFRRTEIIRQRVIERTQALSDQIAVRKKAEETAKIAEAKYRSIFENSLEGIFQTSVEGHYLSANQALAQIYGYDSPEELMYRLGDIAHQLYVRPNRRQEFMLQIQQHGRVVEFESEVYRKDRAIIWIAENARAVRNEAGVILYYEGMVADITHRKQMEEITRRTQHELEDRVQERTAELEASNEALQLEILVRKEAEAKAEAASRAKSAFLANMSHEIRTPMNAILGYAQILQRAGTDNPHQREGLKIILHSGRHLLSLINDILDLSKIEAGAVPLHVEEFDLVALCRSVAAMFHERCREKGIRLTVDLQAIKQSWVSGDAVKLRQVLINLLGNAVKFTDAGEVQLRAEYQGELLQLTVQDTGIGIAESDHQAVFEPFQQACAGRKRGGTGLGLAITRQMVKALGGTLTLESQVGQGTTVRLEVPMQAVPDAAASGGPTVELPPMRLARHVQAMVVDDVPANRAVLADYLRLLGCSVCTAVSGAEALEFTALHTPQIMFLDIVMPGMDGVETLRKLRMAHGTEIKIVALSASVLAHEQARYLAAGFDAVVPKPIELDGLLQTITDLLQIQRGAVGELAPEPAAAVTLEIELPAEWVERLRQAADFGNITELRRIVAELEGIGPAGRRLAALLRAPLQQCQMERIVAVLNELRWPLAAGAV